jgi:hypothetical protein
MTDGTTGLHFGETNPTAGSDLLGATVVLTVLHRTARAGLPAADRHLALLAIARSAAPAAAPRVENQTTGPTAIDLRADPATGRNAAPGIAPDMAKTSRSVPGSAPVATTVLAAAPAVDVRPDEVLPAVPKNDPVRPADAAVRTRRPAAKASRSSLY